MAPSNRFAIAILQYCDMGVMEGGGQVAGEATGSKNSGSSKGREEEAQRERAGAKQV